NLIREVHQTDMLCLSVCYGIAGYVLKTAPERASTRLGGRPLLHYAADSLNSPCPIFLRRDIFKVLFQTGSLPEEEFEGCNCWEFTIGTFRCWPAVLDDLWEICKAFLDHNADPNCTISSRKFPHLKIYEPEATGEDEATDK